MQQTATISPPHPRCLTAPPRDQLMHWALRYDNDVYTSIENIIDYLSDSGWDPLVLSPWVGGHPGWDMLDDGEVRAAASAMGRRIAHEARCDIDLYQSLATGSAPAATGLAVDSPPWSKDPIPGSALAVGYREMLLNNPHALVAADAHGSAGFSTYYSGGSMGRRTATFLSADDLETEAYALAYRGFVPGGVRSGDVMLSLYNATHKGGYLIIRACELLGVRCVTRRHLEEQYVAVLTPATVGRAIRDHEVTIFAGVDPPPQLSTNNLKGDNTSFYNIALTDLNALQQVRVFFLTGFPVPDQTQAVLRSMGKTVFTTWGSTEVMAIATHVPGAQPAANTNDLTRRFYPNHYEVIAYNYDGHCFEATAPGDTGLLCVSSLRREGSVFLNYVIGDTATLTACGVADVNRAFDVAGELLGGCGADALGGVA